MFAENINSQKIKIFIYKKEMKKKKENKKKKKTHQNSVRE